MKRKLKIAAWLMIVLITMSIANGCIASKNKHKGYGPCPCENNK